MEQAMNMIKRGWLRSDALYAAVALLVGKMFH